MRTQLLNIARQFQGAVSPAQREALDQLQKLIGPDVLRRFALAYRRGLAEGPIQLADAIQYFQNLPHQIQAFEELQQQIPEEVHSRFEALWTTTETLSPESRKPSSVPEYPPAPTGSQTMAYRREGTR